MPNYLNNGYKTRGEALAGIFGLLLKNQQTIVSKGFTDDVIISMGDYKLTLHGKTKRVGEGKKKA